MNENVRNENDNVPTQFVKKDNNDVFHFKCDYMGIKSCDLQLPKFTLDTAIITKDGSDYLIKMVAPNGYEIEMRVSAKDKNDIMTLLGQ